MSGTWRVTGNASFRSGERTSTNSDFSSQSSEMICSQDQGLGCLPTQSVKLGDFSRGLLLDIEQHALQSGVSLCKEKRHVDFFRTQWQILKKNFAILGFKKMASPPEMLIFVYCCVCFWSWNSAIQRWSVSCHETKLDL